MPTTKRDLESQDQAISPCPSADKNKLRIVRNQKSSDDRVVFDLDDLDLRDVTPQLWEAISKHNFPPRLFMFGDQPSRIERNEDSGACRLKALNPNRMRREIVERSIWIRHRGRLQNVCPPPSPVVHDVLASENPPLPPLLRITKVPVFVANGRLVQRPGYDADARLFYDPEKDLEIPRVAANPIAELDSAKRLILEELLGDFSFESQADKANAVVLILQPFVRDLIQGPTPMYAVDASSPGSGKTLLAQCATYIAHGDDRSLVPPTDSEEEIRKRVLSLLQEGTPIVQFDNQRRKLNSGVLSAVLTAYPSWKDRKLGVSENLGLPVRNTWILTGNNLLLSDELNRRSIRIRLVPPHERPWERERADFRHPNLIGWVRENRADLIWSALTIISSWVHFQCKTSEKTLGSYEQWAGILGGILEHAQIPGFLENRNERDEDLDADTDAWRTFVYKWNVRFGIGEPTAADLFRAFFDNGGFEETPLLLWGKDPAAKIVSLGRQLGKKKDAIFGGFQITKVPSNGHQSAKWKLVPIGKPE
ncbi:MAG TPA: hypothetical protein VN643_17870 [Pyrinomonadaceae bacterium]|nr:hypothetical protein [Pyrinomonadaceae bacterium]